MVNKNLVNFVLHKNAEVSPSSLNIHNTDIQVTTELCYDDIIVLLYNRTIHRHNIHCVGSDITLPLSINN